jgi:hypothetical protein
MLCLVMIVKNEGKIIARCLRSAVPHIDNWLIVDTGSTDDTVEIIERGLEGIPGKLERRPWVNFGHNRTEAVALAREQLSESEQATTWALLLDADHELVLADREGAIGALPELGADSYKLLQRDAGLEYPNVRLLRLDREWVCTGATHEYWPCTDETPLLKEWTILDHNDGSSHAEKYARDRELLLQELKSEPCEAAKSERAVFYLGQTLEGQGDPGALDLYQWRTELSGHPEEAWVAHYRYGRMLAEAEQQQVLFGREVGHESLRLDDLESVPVLLHAYARRPQRAEPLWRLAKLYRELGQPVLAYIFAKAARALPKPAEGLFVEHNVYSEGIDEELAIASHYVGDKATGAAACERLVHRGNANGQANLPWYTPVLDGERGSYEVPAELRTFDGIGYRCSNPSVCGDVVNIRLVAYTQKNGREYTSLYPDGTIRTRNAIGVVGQPLGVLDESILHVLTGNWGHTARIRGLEDIRLVHWRDRLWLSATCCEVPGAGGKPRVVIGRLSHEQNVTRVDHLVPIQYGGEVEKNWLLWPDGDRLRCIYSFSPLTVLDLDPDTGAVLSETKREWSAPGRLRGSAGPVLLRNGYWLAVAHDVARQPDRNVYTHRFVAWRDGDLRVSGPFFLEHDGIEYCCGMTVQVGGGRVPGEHLTLSYGFEDREAHWLRLPLCNVLDALFWPRGGQDFPIDSSLDSHSASSPS